MDRASTTVRTYRHRQFDENIFRLGISHSLTNRGLFRELWIIGRDIDLSFARTTQSPQGHLLMTPLSHWHCREASVHSMTRCIAREHAIRGHIDMVTDFEVINGSAASSEAAVPTDFGAPRNTGLPANKCICANLNVVTNLNKVIDFNGILNQRVTPAAPINARIGPDLNFVTDAHTEFLGLFPDFAGLLVNFETKSVLTDSYPAMNHTPVTDIAVQQRYVVVDAAVSADGNANANNGVSTDAGPRPDPCTRHHARERF
jgi:hypothetical protein